MAKESLEGFVEVPGVGFVALSPVMMNPALLNRIRTYQKNGGDISLDYIHGELGEPLNVSRPDKAEGLLRIMGSRLITQDEHQRALDWAEKHCPKLHSSLTQEGYEYLKGPCGVAYFEADSGRYLLHEGVSLVSTDSRLREVR